MKKMSTYGKGSEDAVSPVIGVILMVAITVILAAVIAAFVCGMAGNVSKTRSVAVTAQKIGSASGNPAVVVTNNGGPDVQDISWFNVSITTPNGAWINGSTTANNITKSVGSTASFVTDQNRDRVIVTATFVDGTNQVVLDTNV
jgi:flagellin-like protein